MDFITLDLIKKLKLVSAIIETILALTWIWSYLMIMFFILHIITLFFSYKKEAPMMGSMAWVIINLIWWMPIVWVIWRTFHMVVAILLWFDYSRIKSQENQEVKKEDNEKEF